MQAHAAPAPQHAEQVIRNAYVIAQSQLLQLAKQMEFDSDLSIWEEELEDNMRDFWQQTNENVDAFCERMRQGDRADAVAADVVKSPRKRIGKSPARPGESPSRSPARGAAPSPSRDGPSDSPSRVRALLLGDAASPSPSPAKARGKPAPAAEVAKRDADTSVAADHDDVAAAQPRSSTPPVAADKAAAKKRSSTGRPKPEAAAQPQDMPDLPPLPAVTPATGQRTKRTLNSAAARSVKRPAEAAPTSKTPAAQGQRFRSSFLNKSIRKAIEERQVHDDSDESMAADESQDAADVSPEERTAGDAKDDTLKAAPPVDIAKLAAGTDKVSPGEARPASRTHAPGQAFDALRSRLESVRRASAAHGGNPGATVKVPLHARPGNDEAPRTAATARAPRSPGKAQEPMSRSPGRPELFGSPARAQPAPARSPSRQENTVRVPSRQGTVVRSPSRQNLTRSPSRQENLSRSPSRPNLARSPSQQSLTRSPSRPEILTRSPSRQENAPRSPSRILSHTANGKSPWRSAQAPTPRPAAAKAPQAERPASPAPRSASGQAAPQAQPAATQPTSRPVPARSPSPVARSPSPVLQSKSPVARSPSPRSPSPVARSPTARSPSPGRLRDDMLSPFRQAEAGPKRPATVMGSPSPKRFGFGKLRTQPSNPALSPSHARSEAPAPAPARPASVNDAHGNAMGLGARIKGFFGLQHTTQTRTGTLSSRPGSPVHAKVPGARAPANSDEADELEVGLLTEMPGSFTAGAPTPAPGRPAAPRPPRPESRIPTSPNRPAGTKPPRAPVPRVRTASTQSVRAPPAAPASRPESRASAVRVSAQGTNAAKRPKVSQPLGEATNQTAHGPRASTEDALKSKLTTSAHGSTAKTVRLSKQGVPGGGAGGGAGGVRASVSRIGTQRPSAVRPMQPGRVVRPPTAAQGGRAPPGTAQRTSTMNSVNVFQQQPAQRDSSVGPEEASEGEELPDVATDYSDSEDEASIKRRKLEPSWTRGRELEDLLMQQSTVDPDEIFGVQLGPVPLDTMLPARKGDRRRARNRTSSANWSGPDGLSQWEIDRYNERMGIRSDAPPLGRP